MLLILCQLDDLDALAFAHRARAEGTDCRILTAEALSFARRRSHRIGRPDGASGPAVPVRTEIEVRGLPLIDDLHYTGVLNRLVAPPDTAWRRATDIERSYAGAEMFAFTLSWLSGLDCPVRNRPTPGCLAGPAPHPLVVLSAAARVGLRCPDLRYRTDSAAPPDLGAAARAAAGPHARARQVVFLDGRPLADDLPVGLAGQVAGMLDALGAAEDLMGADFVVGSESWVFTGLTPLPLLGGLGRAGRQALLDILATDRTAVA